MTLSVVEVFATVQGEGSLTGSPAVFVRLAGCNLWNGLESGRASGKGGCAVWCDTYFAKGTRHEVGALARAVDEHRDRMAAPLVVITGGEPLLQLSGAHGLRFIESLKTMGWKVAIETNGTLPLGDAADLIDHVTVSPKPLAHSSDLKHIVLREGTDLKVVVPTPFNLDALGVWDFKHRFVQPCDRGDNGRGNVPLAVTEATRLGWRVSFQTHKWAGLP